jgi:hypothetical protein
VRVGVPCDHDFAYRSAVIVSSNAKLRTRKLVSRFHKQQIRSARLNHLRSLSRGESASNWNAQCEPEVSPDRVSEPAAANATHVVAGKSRTTMGRERGPEIIHEVIPIL